MTEFKKQFKQIMENAGLGIQIMDNLPEATKKKRKTYESKPSKPAINNILKKEKSKTFFDFLKKYFK